MNVVHIIPAGFNYFEDLKNFVFSIVDLQNGCGVESHAITLQYSGFDIKREKDDLDKIKKKAKTKKELPRYKFKGVKTIDKAVGDLDKYDIVHMHLPFLGAGKLILDWKKEYPSTPFVVSYYYDFAAPDFFGLIVKYYNKYYAPKLLNIADMVVCVDLVMFKKSLGFRFLKDKTKLFVLKSKGLVKSELLTNSKIKVKLSGKKFKKEVAEDMISAYLMLINTLKK